MKGENWKKDDYRKDDCSMINEICVGADCHKRNYPLPSCKKCQCFFCTMGICILDNKEQEVIMSWEEANIRFMVGVSWS